MNTVSLHQLSIFLGSSKTLDVYRLNWAHPERQINLFLYHNLTKPGIAGSIPGFTSLSDETLSRGPISIWP